MPQTSPMSWLILSVIPMMIMATLINKKMITSKKIKLNLTNNMLTWKW